MPEESGVSLCTAEVSKWDERDFCASEGRYSLQLLPWKLCMKLVSDILDFDTATVRIIYIFYKMKKSADIVSVKNETC